MMSGDEPDLRFPAWNQPAEHPAFDDRQVHLWLVDLSTLENEIEILAATLDEGERARAARFLVPAPRRQFVAARGILRRLLARYLRCDIADVGFAFGNQGKPYLAGQYSADVRFNVSHSGDLILLAFARGREVGVDIERIHFLQAGDAVAERFFTLPEAHRIRRLPESERERAFFHHWVRKEAFVKAVGKGIASGLSSEVEVLSCADDPPPAVCNVIEPHQGTRWRLFSFELGTHYLGALSAAGNDWAARFWQWPGCDVAPAV